jgi:hypothetical protein
MATTTVTPVTKRWERYAWAAGGLFVLALLAESIVSTGVGVDQNDSAETIATSLLEHRTRLIVIACLSIVYALSFVIYLWRLHRLLRDLEDRARGVAFLAVGGGILFVTLHAVSDIGITGLLGAKLAKYGAQHDHGLSYALYLLTFALDSVGDVLGSVFAAAVGWTVLRTGVLPRILGWAMLLVAVCFVLQGFGLGGVIANFGLVVDLVGFLLLLIFIATSSVILMRRRTE